MASSSIVPALALVAGTACGVYTAARPGPFLCLLVLLVAVWVARRLRGAAAPDWLLVTAGFLVTGLTLGADARIRALDSGLRTRLDEAYGGFAIDTPGPEGDHDPLLARFRLIEDAIPGEGVVSLRAQVTGVHAGGVWQPVPGDGVRLAVSGEASYAHMATWTAGRTLTAPVTFRRPTRYLNDGVPDFERDLMLAGAALNGSVKSGLLVDVDAYGTAIEEVAAAVRAHVRTAISRWVSRHDALAGAIVIAVLIGDRTGLPADVRQRLQAAGTYHVIAISGGNIAILAGLTLVALLLAGISGRPAAAVTLGVLLAYAQVVTAGPSVWRATLMAVLYLLARLLDHRTPSWHVLPVSAALMLAARPLDIRDPGFMLSFGATAALLAGATWGNRLLDAPPFVSHRHALQRRVGRWVLASLVASAAVELALMPVSAQAFSRVTVAGLALNLLAVPLMTVVQLAGIAVVVTSGFDVLASAAGWAAWASATALVESARLVDVLPLLSRRVPPPGLVLIAAYYAGLATAIWLWRRARPAGVLLVVVPWLVIVSGVRAHWSEHRAEPGTLRLTVFDVGQAEAMLLEASGTRPILIDAGGTPFGDGRFDLGGRVLAPALWARGVLRLEALLVTHGDPDHLGGAAAVLSDFAPRRLWTGVPVPPHEPSRHVAELADRLGIASGMLRAADTWTFGGARVRVLHPPEPDWERQRVRNDDSVVLEVLFGDVALLLTGDISATIERAIVPHLTPAPIRVLKVGHHGSRTSSSRELLEAWRPQIAVISAGRGNTFGHPAPEVVERLEAVGATVLRTDLHGQITIETDGQTVRTRTWVTEETNVGPRRTRRARRRISRGGAEDGLEGSHAEPRRTRRRRGSDSRGDTKGTKAFGTVLGARGWRGDERVGRHHG